MASITERVEEKQPSSHIVWRAGQDEFGHWLERVYLF